MGEPVNEKRDGAGGAVIICAGHVSPVAQGEIGRASDCGDESTRAGEAGGGCPSSGTDEWRREEVAASKELERVYLLISS